MPIDIHAHYVPPQFIAAVRARGANIGVRLAGPPGGEALRFYGFKVRPFFARLIEPAAAATFPCSLHRFAIMAGQLRPQTRLQVLVLLRHGGGGLSGLRSCQVCDDINSFLRFRCFQCLIKNPSNFIN